MNKFYKLALVLLFFFLFSNNVYAYTKDDISNLVGSVNVCSESVETFNDFVNAYSKLIKERNISDSNLNIIYNDLSRAINICTSNNVCTYNDLSMLSKSTKDELKELYNNITNIIKSSPKLVSDNSGNDIDVVVKTDKKEIEIYSGNVLKNVVNSRYELNYVGLNKSLITIIYIFISLFILSLTKILLKKDILSISLLYVSVFSIIFLYTFRNSISSILDFMPKTNDGIVKDVVVFNKDIISYPSYGNNYGYIYINDDKEVLFYGDKKEVISNGIGTSSTNSMPGEDGRVILSGHNTGIFSNLFNLDKNDEVTIETLYGVFKYKVEKKEVVNKYNINSIKQDYDLIMYTCSPRINIYGNNRLVVYASLIESKWLGE